MTLRIAIAVAALAVAGQAFAQAPAAGPSPDMQAARAALRQACMGDSKALCDGKRGREAMMCLRGNAEKLSEPCKDALLKAPQRERSGGRRGGVAPSP